MPEEPVPALTSLFSAMAAHLSADAQGAQLILTDVVTHGQTYDVACAAAMAAGEYLRDAADARGMPAPRMLDILCSAHEAMTREQPQSVEGLILAGTQSYLAGQGELWNDQQLQALRADPYRAAFAAVCVASAALTWHATDLGVSPAHAAQRTCLSLAARQCLPTP